MTESAAPEELDLLEGVVRWSDQSLVRRIAAQELRLSPQAVETFYRGRENRGLVQLQQRNRLLEGMRTAADAAGTASLTAAWRALFRDFRQRVVRGDLRLKGLETKSGVGSGRVPIEALRAADYEFDLHDNRIRCGTGSYVAVVVSNECVEAPSRAAAPAVAGTIDPTGLTADQIARLTPENVAELLQLHAEQVIRGLRATLLPPGYASVIALILSKLEHRDQIGAREDQLQLEAAWLAEWAKKVAPAWDAPGEKTIMNKIGRRLKEMKAEAAKKHA